MWTSLILAWVAVNVALVLLLWRRAHVLNRRSAARATLPPDRLFETYRAAIDKHTLRRPAAARDAAQASASASTNTQRPRTRVVVVANGHQQDTALPAAPLTPRDAPCPVLHLHEDAPRCRVKELQAEIRDLKLTVAELSLDRARLSSAMARQRC